MVIANDDYPQGVFKVMQEEIDELETDCKRMTGDNLQLRLKNKRLQEDLEYIADEWAWCACGAAECAKRFLEEK